MFTAKITDEQRRYAYGLVTKTNFGKRKIKEGELNTSGNIIQQYTGILGQVVLADLIDHPRPDGTGGYDGGVDFMIRGYAVDLKTMARDYDVSPHYVNNIWESQCDDKGSKTDVYAFASINKKTRIFTFCGLYPRYLVYNERYVPKGANRELYKKGEVIGNFALKAGMYEIPNTKLIQVNSSFELADKVSHIYL